MLIAKTSAYIAWCDLRQPSSAHETRHSETTTMDTELLLVKPAIVTGVHGR